MALQAASLVSSSFAVPKEGKSNASFKDSSLFGVSLSEHVKADLSSCSLKCKSLQREFSHRAGAVRAQTMVAATPEVDRTSSEGKKTLRQGTCIVTGASSGQKGLLNHLALLKENYTIMHLDLASLDSVRQFVDTFRRSGRPLDVLVCNAAVYFPTAKEPTFSAEGFELSVGTNHLGHFLLSRLLLEDMKKSDYPSKRLIIVGSITGNTNTLAGNVPPKANLGDLRGLSGGLNGLNSSSMIDGGVFDGAKAYKDSKACSGSTFPCSGFYSLHSKSTSRRASSPSSKLGKRLAQVVSDPSLTKSGVYWSWNKDSASFQNQLSEEASDAEKARKVWEVSEKLVGLA
ncbi:hypothetical protein OIU84_003011 [Salix udensis]|uniref:protochlorophyllide reductase n=1 Tax=Salix udensis TaxID=889485 RepID=A0AAD6K5D9_9ROSI|nr:hypothetical protein OIU84_003011 [Salix udensis]